MPTCCNCLANKVVVITWAVLEILFHIAVYLTYVLTIGFQGYSIWSITTFDILLIVGVVKEDFGKKIIRIWLGVKCVEIIIWIVAAIVVSVLTFGYEIEIIHFTKKDNECIDTIDIDSETEVGNSCARVENHAIKVMTFVILFTMPLVNSLWWIMVYSYRKSKIEDMNCES